MLALFIILVLGAHALGRADLVLMAALSLPFFLVVKGAAFALRGAKTARAGSVQVQVSQTSRPRRIVSTLAQDLPDALANGAIQPWFQPQVDGCTGAVTGFEALARWHHPVHGVLAPVQFLDAVEHAGLMDDLGRAIRRQALRGALAWDRAGWKDLTVSVNACASDLANPTYAEEVAWDLDAADLDPARLIVEVLETVAADAQDDAVMATLAALRQRGIGLDLDDFGIGQASLWSIQRFGISRIKIDRSFVTGIDQDQAKQALVGGIISLSRGMGLNALAEGVETAREQETLRALGCTHLQGYAIAKPMPLAATLPWLANHAQEMVAPPAAAE